MFFGWVGYKWLCDDISDVFVLKSMKLVGGMSNFIGNCVPPFMNDPHSYRSKFIASRI
jgi:hypothetical protein